LRQRRSTSRESCLLAPFHPQGLATLAVVCSLRSLASFVSRWQHSWEVPFGAFPSREVPGRFRPSELTYRLTQQFLRRREASVRPDGFRFLSFTSRESLAPCAFLVRRTLDAPLGFALPGCPRNDLARISPGLLSLAWTRTTEAVRARNSEYQSAAAWSPPPAGKPATDETTLIRFSRRLHPGHSTARHLRAMGSPHPALSITAMSRDLWRTE
jgi:hypothetical protein